MQYVHDVSIGDYLEFTVDGVNKPPVIMPAVPVGSGAVAVFVAYEKEQGSVSIWYHYFENLKNTQVAVIDVAGPGSTLKQGLSSLACEGGSCLKGKVETIPTDKV